MQLGVTNKGRPQSVARRFVQCGHFSDKVGGGSSEVDSALFGAKNFKFFEIYGVSARTTVGGGVEPVRTFFGQGGGVNYSRFCVDVFYGRSLNVFDSIFISSQLDRLRLLLKLWSTRSATTPST